MQGLAQLGRLFFALSMVVFGIQNFVYAGFVAGLEFVPAWLPFHTPWGYCTGFALIYAGVSIALEKKARPAALLLGLAFFLCVLARRLPAIAEVLHDVGERTRFFETLAMCGGALLLAGILPYEHGGLDRWNAAADKLAVPGRYFLAISMAVFGVDHLLVPNIIAGLIPAWIPWHWFWVYFTALGMIAAAVSIAFEKGVRLAAPLLGLMFLVWVVLLHAPRVAGALHNVDEWNSAFVALTMCGCAWAVVSSRPVQIISKDSQSQLAHSLP